MEYGATSLWRNRDYLLLASGQGISEVGSQVSSLAFILLVLALTHSPAQAGLAGALGVLPNVVLSIPAGALVDRWDRRRLMMICDITRALCLASIPIAFALGFLTVIQLYIVEVVEGSFAVFFYLAQKSALPRVVTKEQLPAAVGQNQAISWTAILLGPPLSGVLYSVSRVFPFLVDALSYLVSVISLFLIKTPFQLQRRTERRNFSMEIKEGFLWLWHQPLLRFMTLMVGSLNLTVAGIDLIVVVLAQQMHATPFIIGLIFAVGSIGGIGGAFVGPALQKRLSYGAAVIGVCWLTALLWPLFAIAPNVIIVGIIFAAYLIWGRILSVVNFSYRTALTPDEMQGRVLGVSALVVLTTPALGLALTGILIQSLGVVPTILIISASRLLIALVVTLNPHVRNAPPLSELKSA